MINYYYLIKNYLNDKYVLTLYYHSDNLLSYLRNRGIYMKKIQMIIRPEKLSLLQEVLESCDVKGMMISNIMGYGNQKGHTKQYRGTTYASTLVSKLKVETVVKDQVVEDLVKKICEKLSTGAVGDGKIFISDVENAVRIRTGESGEDAL